MLKAGDGVVPKLDLWKKLRITYAESVKKELPEDPPVFTVKSTVKHYPGYTGSCCVCHCSLPDESHGLTIMLGEEDLLKAP